MKNVLSLAQEISKPKTAQDGVVTGQLLNAPKVKMENSQMNNPAHKYANQPTGRSVTLVPRNVKDATQEIQDAILMLTAMLHVVFLELFAIILQEHAMTVILSKIRIARKLRELVTKIVQKSTMIIQYAISELVNATNVLLIQLHQVVFQMEHAMLLVNLNLHLNTYMNAIGLQLNQLATKLKMVPKPCSNATPTAEHIVMENVTILKRNASAVTNQKTQTACTPWTSARSLLKEVVVKTLHSPNVT